MSIGSKNFDKIQNLDQLNQEIKSEIERYQKIVAPQSDQYQQDQNA